MDVKLDKIVKIIYLIINVKQVQIINNVFGMDHLVLINVVNNKMKLFNLMIAKLQIKVVH